MTQEIKSRHAEIAQLVNALRVGVVKSDPCGLATRDPTFVEAVGRVGCDCLVCRGMTQEEVVKWIREHERTEFSVRFVKRTTGELREMKCKTGVWEYLAGSEAKYDFKKKDLIPVFDVEKNWYRSISIEGIVAIKIDEVWIDVRKE